MDEIVKIVANKNLERKPLGKNEIKKICNILKSKYKYSKDYKIDFVNHSPFNDGTYGLTSEDAVTFYKDALVYAQESAYNIISDMGRVDGSKIDVYNFITLDAIFHEFTHIAQRSIASSRRNNLDSKLFNICIKLKGIKDFYDDNYMNFITEVNAYCRGIVNAYNIYSQMPDELITKDDKSLYASCAMGRFKRGYHVDVNNEIIFSASESLCESADYFNTKHIGVDIEEFKKLINQDNDLTLYKKMILGLPLTYMEYAYFNLLSSCIDSGSNVNFVKKLQKRI